MEVGSGDADPGGQAQARLGALESIHAGRPPELGVAQPWVLPVTPPKGSTRAAMHSHGKAHSPPPTPALSTRSFGHMPAASAFAEARAA